MGVAWSGLGEKRSRSSGVREFSTRKGQRKKNRVKAKGGREEGGAGEVMWFLKTEVEWFWKTEDGVERGAEMVAASVMSAPG